MLDLMRENTAAVQASLRICQALLRGVMKHLKALDPELGEAELINLVAAEQANLGEMANLREMAKLGEMDGKTQPQERPGAA